MLQQPSIQSDENRRPCIDDWRRTRGRSLQPARIGVVNRIVQRIPIKILVTNDANRIFAQPATVGWIVVTRSVEVESCFRVELPIAIPEQVDDCASGRNQVSV